MLRDVRGLVRLGFLPWAAAALLGAAVAGAFTGAVFAWKDDQWM